MSKTINKPLPKISDLPVWAQKHGYCRELYEMYLTNLSDRAEIERAQKTPVYRQIIIKRIEKALDR